MKSLVARHSATDTTIRQTAMAELEAMSPRPSQWTPDESIPEKSWVYRLGKKMLYHDFGAYERAGFSPPPASPNTSLPVVSVKTTSMPPQNPSH
jgi:hypothetical protein